MTNERNTEAGLTERAHHTGDGKPAAPRQRRSNSNNISHSYLLVGGRPPPQLASRRRCLDLCRFRRPSLERQRRTRAANPKPVRRWVTRSRH